MKGETCSQACPMIAGGRRPRLLLVFLLLMLTSCAGRNVQDISMVDSSVTPGQVQGRIAAYRGRTVQWGGVIVGVLSDKPPLLLDILSYPLDRQGNPDESIPSSGRFLAELPPAIDGTSFVAGRYVTVTGSISREMSLQIGSSSVALPVLESTGVHLWGRDRPDRGRGGPVFSFGVGVRL